MVWIERKREGWGNHIVEVVISRQISFPFGKKTKTEQNRYYIHKVPRRYSSDLLLLSLTECLVDLLPLRPLRLLGSLFC